MTPPDIYTVQLLINIVLFAIVVTLLMLCMFSYGKSRGWARAILTANAVNKEIWDLYKVQENLNARFHPLPEAPPPDAFDHAMYFFAPVATCGPLIGLTFSVIDYINS